MPPCARPNSMKSIHCRPVYRPTTRVATDPTTTTMMTPMRKAQRNRSTNDTRRIKPRRIEPSLAAKNAPGGAPKTLPASDSSPRHLMDQRARSGLPHWEDLLRILPWLAGRRIRADDLVDGDVRIGAVTVPIAGDGSGEALVVLRRKEGVPESLPPDIERPALRLGDLLDRGEDHHRGIVRVGVEPGRRLLPKLLFVLRHELLAVPRAQGFGREIRAAEVHAPGRVACRFGEVGREQAVRPHQLGVLQALDLARLPRDEPARGDEDRVVDQIGLAGGNPSEHRLHVRIGRRDRLLTGNRPSLLLEVLGERVREPLGVRTAIVDG